jgi:hypothetical protein
MSVSPYLDSVLGISEGGSQGAQILAGLKTAGIETGGYAPWILGASVATNTLGKYLSRAADAPFERQQLRLGNQQLEVGGLQIEAERRRQTEERLAQKKQKALQGVMSRIFAQYSTLKGDA